MSERATPETDAFYLRRVCVIDEEGIRAEWKHCERHARRLERQRDALADALRELLDDVTNGEDDWVAGTSVARARALLAELEAKR